MATVTSSQGGYATQHSQPTTSLEISASDGKDGFATKHSGKIDNNDDVCIDTKTEHTHNPDDDCNECVDGIKTGAFEPRTPEGEEPVRFDFADQEEISLNPTIQQNKSSMQLELHADFHDGNVWLNGSEGHRWYHSSGIGRHSEGRRYQKKSQDAEAEEKGNLNLRNESSTLLICFENQWWFPTESVLRSVHDLSAMSNLVRQHFGIRCDDERFGFISPPFPLPYVVYAFSDAWNKWKKEEGAIFFGKIHSLG